MTRLETILSETMKAGIINTTEAVSIQCSVLWTMENPVSSDNKNFAIEFGAIAGRGVEALLSNKGGTS